jgi:hypothetical protein
MCLPTSFYLFVVLLLRLVERSVNSFISPKIY